MFHILDDLQDRAERHLLGTSQGSFERKKRIISQSLYGVDVMEWACHVAELRLWLALIIDEEFSEEELLQCDEPMLPNFSFKIRCGDSLIQKLGDIDLAGICGPDSITGRTKSDVTKFMKQKLMFYRSDPECEFKTDLDGRSAEKRIFRAILTEEMQRIQKEMSKCRRKLGESDAPQIRTDGTIERSTVQMELDHARTEKKLDELSLQLDRVKSVIGQLKTEKQPPFVWNLAFVEIFQRNNSGFDIVVGNPPYVRQEKIADPKADRDQVTAADKKRYKASLAQSVYVTY